MKKENVLNILLSVGMVILLLSAFLPLVDVKTPWLRYIFTFAAMLIVVVRVFQRAARRKQTFSLRVRRLFTMEFWSAMCYVVSALFLFSDPYHSTWLGFLTAGAVVQVYASFMIDYQLRQEAKKAEHTDVAGKQHENVATEGENRVKPPHN